jgi:hypothetical protein
MWLYNKQEFTSEMIGDSYGFVYLITCTITGQKYIGRKFFWSKKTLQPLKGKKNKRHKLIESDWKDYWSSSKYVHELIEQYGKENFIREIISIHPNKQETNYRELCEQIIRNVLDSRTENGEKIYLNENIERRYFPSERFYESRNKHHQESLEETHKVLSEVTNVNES